MTQDDIIRMAREQGLSEYMQGAVATFFQIGLEEGAEAEREACAKVCERIAADNYGELSGRTIPEACATAIRARGQK
jgi:hypothetical protein